MFLRLTALSGCYRTIVLIRKWQIEASAFILESFYRKKSLAKCGAVCLGAIIVRSSSAQTYHTRD